MIKTQRDLENIYRSIAYHCTSIPITLLMGIAYLPLLAMNHPKLKADIPLQWTGIMLYLQKKILKLDYTVHSEIDLSQAHGIFAAKHQSAWETIALWHILNRPVFVLKKELLSIPIFGWYLGKADNIVIDRSAGQKAIGQIIEQAMQYLTQGRSIVLFPEGTRTQAGATVRYKQGIANVYEALQPTIYPVALNSGVFWPRNSLIRKSGTVEMHVLSAMEQGLSKQEFMEELQRVIETQTAKLVDSPIFPDEPDYLG